MTQRGAGLKEAGRLLLRIVVTATIIGLLIIIWGGLLLGAALVVITYVEPSDQWEAAIYAAAFILTGVGVLWLFPIANAIGGRVLAWEAPDRKSSATVAVTCDAIIYPASGDESESVLWRDIAEVVIANVDAWPVGDQFFLIRTQGGVLAVPASADGASRLLASMQERLDGFDNEAVIQAMGSLDASFLVWQRTDDAEG